MKYSKHSLRARKKQGLTTHSQSWAFDEGVFKTPQGFYIARVYKVGSGFVTLSKHDTEDDANKVYEDFYKANPKNKTK